MSNPLYGWRLDPAEISAQVRFRKNWGGVVASGHSDRLGGVVRGAGLVIMSLRLPDES